VETNALKSHYDSDVADSYEATRHNAKWAAEQAAVEQMLSTIPAGATVLDVPVGTGRFLQCYSERRFRVLGIDSSQDMLDRAINRHRIDTSLVTLRRGDIFQLANDGVSADVSVCVRFMNLVSTKDMSAVIAELAAVSKQNIIVGIRHIVPLTELRLWRPRDLRRLLGRLASFVRFRIEGKIVLHPFREIQAAFERAGLTVANSVCIERRGDGTDYCIYLLAKRRQ
jgi:2-polyprenyl-3-methyl-5-hydroxy-6-metoxy-1,4-benzoquinol methylase